ncbi:MAG: metallophosphoesterase [Desulfurococcaceae archaeon]
MLRPIMKNVNGLHLVVGSPFIYIENSSTLVMADLHFGFEEAASRGLVYSVRKTSGYYAIFVPRIQFRKTISYLERTLDKLRVKRVIINGDLKHAFDRLLRQEKDEVVGLIRFLRDNGVNDVIVIRGNHDNFIKPVLRKLDVEFANSISTIVDGKRILLTHGHEEVDILEHDLIIIGHEHPSLKCFDTYRFPCFMKIPMNDDKLIVVMPATGPYHPGVVVTPSPSDYLSPLLRKMKSLESTSIITWIDLGEASVQGANLLESMESSNYVNIERFIVSDREYGVVEFKNYMAVQLLCQI